MLNKRHILSISELSIVHTTCGSASHYGVFADKMVIPKGTRFGPFTGKQVNTSEIKTYDDNTLMWEVSRLLNAVDHLFHQLI